MSWTEGSKLSLYDRSNQFFLLLVLSSVTLYLISTVMPYHYASIRVCFLSSYHGYNIIQDCIIVALKQ